MYVQMRIIVCHAVCRKFLLSKPPFAQGAEIIERDSTV